MGVGFVVGGYCPGTSFCGAAIGRIDGMVFVIGGLVGTNAGQISGAESSGNVSRNFGERLALRKQLRPQNVRSNIAIARMEPDRLSQLPHRLQAVERIALHAPAALLAE